MTRPTLPLNVVADTTDDFTCVAIIRDADREEILRVESASAREAMGLAAHIVAACNMVEKVEALAKSCAFRAEACSDTATLVALDGVSREVAKHRAECWGETATALRDILKEVS